VTTREVCVDLRRHNFLLVGDDAYFVFVPRDMQPCLVSARCAHRGGPLHLARFDDASGCLVCPWHGSRTSESRLRSRALESRLEGHHLRVQVAAGPAVPIEPLDRQVLANGDRLDRVRATWNDRASS